MDHEVIDLAEAISRGLKYYFPGKPCSRGHLSKRRVSNRTCCHCVLDNAKAWQAKNREKTLAMGARYRDQNRSLMNEKRRNFYYKNKDRLKAARSAKRRANLEEYRAKDREEKRRNPQKPRPEYNRAYIQNRRQNDLDFKLRSNFSARIIAAVRRRGGKKSHKTIQLLGCAIPEFMRQIEGSWKSGWDWSNWGASWELDHIIPCSSFSLENPEEQKICFHWLNYRPLDEEENARKSGSVANVCVALRDIIKNEIRISDEAASRRCRPTLP